MREDGQVRTLVRLSLTALYLGVLRADAQNANQNQNSFTLHEVVKEVMLYCTVVDRKGSPVTDLDRASFHVQEDKAPVPVGHFSHQETPASISIVLDDSESMKEKHSAVQGGALQFIQAAKPDEAFLMDFADTAYIDQEFTTDRAQVERAVSASTTVAGGTALFDTLIAAADRLSEKARNSKRVIIVMSDGNDNASAADLHAAIQRVQGMNGPVIYAIGLLYDLPGAEARRARKTLSTLAEETGGEAFFPASTAEVVRAADQAAADIHSQYMIGFRPLPDSGSGVYHTVTVRVSAQGRGSLSVRTRKGFFGGPSPTAR